MIQTSPRKVLQGVRDRAVRLALIHPDVSFKLLNVDRLESLLCTKSCSSSLDRLCEFFGKHLHHELSDLYFVKNPWKVDGFISKENSRCSSKAVQFLYLNGRFVHKTPVHKLINDLFQNRRNSHELENLLGCSFSLATAKQVYPMYLINLHCPLSTYDITFEATKTAVEFKDWKSILTFVTEALGTKWRKIIDNCSADDDDTSDCKSIKRSKRKLSWQHVDPSYHPRGFKRSPKANGDATKCIDHSTNLEQNFTSHITRGTRSPRKRKADWKRPLFDESPTCSWGLQPCDVKKLDENLWLYQDQCGLRERANPVCEMETSLAYPGGRRDCVQDGLSTAIIDLENGDIAKGTENSFSIFMDSEETSGRIPVEDPDTHCLSPRKDIIPLGGRWNDSSIYYVAGESHGHLLPDGTESKDNIDNFVQASPQVYRRRPRVRRCLYQLEIKPSCRDSFLCHSERKSASNLEVQNIDQNREGILNTKKPAFFVDVSRCDFSRSMESMYEEEYQHDDLISSRTHPLLDFESSKRPQRSRIDEFHALQEQALLNGVMDKGDDIFAESPVMHLIERPPSMELQSLNLPAVVRTVGKEADCIKESWNSELTPKNPELPKVCTLQRTLSGPPFYQAPRKYGASVGLPTIEHPLKPRSRYDSQSKVDLFEKTEGASSKGESCQEEKQLISSLKYRQRMPVGKEADHFIHDRRALQEDILFHKDFDFIPEKDYALSNLGSKWRETTFDDSILTDISASQLYKNWRNPCIGNAEPRILDLSSEFLGANTKSLLPESITKEALQKMQVLQQVDKKFIASVADNVLVMIDQHAADERIRLEQLRTEVLEQQHLSTLLDYPTELGITMHEQQLLHTYKTQVEGWGWRFKLTDGTEKRYSEEEQCYYTAVLVTAVPSILGESLINPKHLSEYLHQLMTTDGISAPPPAVQRLLASKACRGAIMFGDTLLRSECQQLVEGLKRTALSFQCAHGRPTLVPIVNLDTLRMRLSRSLLKKNKDRSDLYELESKEKWHGLEWKRPTLSRAKERLQRAD
ncbi:hypothetical protein KP509_08G039800 [Ceratopteris richardii]|nr:hypothetical protein KP509_08G039800 [Ceratopteris richardii]